MLWSIRELQGYTIEATDDTFGAVADIYFHDVGWVARYVVADTRRWLPGRQVLIPLGELKQPDRRKKTFSVSLTRQEVEEAPSLAADEPVSRQHEEDLHAYFGWRPYWVRGPFEGPVPTVERAREYEGEEEEPIAEDAKKQGGHDRHLRSAGEIQGYDVHAGDEDVGHVEDLVLDDESWLVKFIVINTRDFLPGGKNLVVATDRVEAISWEESSVRLSLDRDKVEALPELTGAKPTHEELMAVRRG
jgi:sporulation protein YlmC with PRC-barrel domain